MGQATSRVCRPEWVGRRSDPVQRVKGRPRRSLAQGSEIRFQLLLAVRELVVRFAADQCDPRKDEPAALMDQLLVRVWIERSDLCGHVGEVVLDGSSAGGVLIYEEKTVLRVEHVVRMRFAVQDLLMSASVPNGSCQARESVADQLPI